MPNDDKYHHRRIEDAEASYINFKINQKNAKCSFMLPPIVLFSLVSHPI